MPFDDTGVYAHRRRKFVIVVDSELFNRVGRWLRWRIPLAHAFGALLALGSGALTSIGLRRGPGFGTVDVVAFCAYFAFIIPVLITVGHRVARLDMGWIEDGRAPSALEQRRTLQFSGHIAGISMLGWLGAAGIWSVIVGFDHSAAYTVRVVLSILLGGLATCGLSYFIVEAADKPMVALALATEAPETMLTPGIRTKLWLSWAIGSDVFLIMIALTFLGRPVDEPPSRWAIWFIVVFGLVAGSAVIVSATRSLVLPLQALRLAVGRVRRGDLDVQVAVDDGGEIGLLQAGFNEMVTDLRDRQRIRDLFGRHVGEDVARQAMRNGVTLGGEQRTVGVLFVDIIDSTGLAEQQSPDAVVGLLNDFFGAVVRIVGSQGGWVNKFEGDGALCIFGAPVHAEDHPAQTLRAARLLREALHDLAQIHPELDAAIGASGGMVVAGNVGAAERFEYTVIGSAVNQAARLSEAAKAVPGRVLATGALINSAGTEADNWAPGGDLELRGLSAPVPTFVPRVVTVHIAQAAPPA